MPHLNLSANIWLNPRLNIDKKPFLWKQWAVSGILVLGDLYDKGIMKSFTVLKQQFALQQQPLWRYFKLDTS